MYTKETKLPQNNLRAQIFSNSTLFASSKNDFFCIFQFRKSDSVMSLEDSYTPVFRHCVIPPANGHPNVGQITQLLAIFRQVCLIFALLTGQWGKT